MEAEAAAYASPEVLTEWPNLAGSGESTVGGKVGMDVSVGVVHLQGWPEAYMCTVYGRMYGDFPARNTVYAPYIRMYV